MKVTKKVLDDFVFNIQTKFNSDEFTESDLIVEISNKFGFDNRTKDKYLDILTGYGFLMKTKDGKFKVI